MWKKLLVALLTLCGTVSLGYMYYNRNMSAAVIGSCANVSGRMGILKQGDLIKTSAGDFRIIKPYPGSANINTAVKTLYLALTNDSLAKKPYGTTSNTSANPTTTIADQSYSTSFVRSYIRPLTGLLTAGDYKIFSPHQKGSFLSQASGQNTRADWNDNIPANEVKYIFPIVSVYTTNDDIPYSSFPVGGSDPTLAFKEEYWLGFSFTTTGGFSQAPVTVDGKRIGVVGTSSGITNTPRGIRAAALIDSDQVVFSLNDACSQAGAYISEPQYNAGALMTTATGDAMKVRYLDPTRTISFQKITRISDPSSPAVSKVKSGRNAYITYSGLSSGQASLLVKDAKNSFYYYQKLGQNASDTVEIDTSSWALGTYQLYLVNEEVTATDAPVASSDLVSAGTLTIVPPLASVTFTPQGKLTFLNNVAVNDPVGTISSQGGVDPITYQIISDPGYPNEYQNFKIDPANPSAVIIDGNGPDIDPTQNQLNAGDYHFIITALDADGEPVDGSGKPSITTKVTIHVDQAELKVQFNQPNATKLSIAQAALGVNETATATPNNSDMKVTYAIKSGVIGLINIDSNTGAITYTGSNGFGKVVIEATADDDPTTGNDNYIAAHAQKEVIIYREVDGSVKPHADSDDIITPTFQTSDANVKPNGIIGTIIGSSGTPDDLTSAGKTTYTYGLKNVDDFSYFQVNPNSGEIITSADLSSAAGSYHITVTVSDKWSTKEIPVTINVSVAGAEDLKFYENSTSNTVITTQSAKITDTNVFVYATVKGSSNMNPVTYKVKDGSTNVVEVNPNSGKLSLNGVGSVTIVAEKAGASGQADAVSELTFTVMAGEQDFIYTDATLSNELPKTGDKYDAKEEVYEKGKTFQLYTAGYPTGATVTYQLKAGSPTDVISVDSNGLVHILNASISPSQIGKVIVEATSHDPSNHYIDKTIELPINIKKADQTISFVDITYATSGKGKVTPVINEQDISSNDGGVQVNDTDYYITIDSSINTAVAWTNNGVDIEYDFNGKNGLNIPLHVEKPGNRNYNKAEANGSMRIMGPDESTLAINRPGKIIYGDHFEIKSLQDDSGSTNVQYQFEVDNTTYISAPTVNGNKAEFDALQFSGRTNINIKVTRTADGETPLSKTISVQVLPKEIEIIIDDKDKYKGEVNPPLTYQDFKSQLVSWNGVQDVIQEHDIKLSTTAQTNSPAGSYPIHGDANSLNNTYPNYNFKFVDGTLEVKEDNIEDDWYHMEIADGSHTPYTGEWTNQDVTIISDHPDYINLSLDQSTWNPQKATVNKEGETNQSFWMKKNSGAITKEKQEIIRIDKTPPKVKGIKAKDSNNQLQDIINKLSGGIFFKPGTVFEITTSDENGDLKVSGTKEISCKIYKLQTAARSGEEEISSGTLSVTNEKASITISETTGTYRVCVIPTDNAGNSNTESCHEVTVKKIDVDVDDDGEPDFNDPDGDGCPDLNIKWKDPNDSNQWIVINGDRDNDGIPDLNIDSDGDGKPDLNIDTDNDGKPDLNLVILNESNWKPTKCVKQDIDNGILEEYCTGTDVKAVINIDIDGDGIPDINIDNQGDFKPHLNVSKDGKTPYLNIIALHEWKPKKDYQSGKFTYDSIGKDDAQREINIDTDDDGYPDINLDIDGDGEPDLNIDLDGDEIPDIDIDSTGDGIPDVNVDTDGDGKPDKNIVEIKEWKPDKNVDGEMPYDTMGDITIPQDPTNDEPTEPKQDDNPKTPTNNTTNVQGQYNPSTSMGGVETGDHTNLMYYIGLSLFTSGILCFLIYKRKKS